MSAPSATPHLCEPCQSNLSYSLCACDLCGLSVQQKALSSHFHLTICGACIKRPPPWQQLSAVFRYEAELQWLVQQYKVQKQRYLMTDFEGMLTQHIQHQLKNNPWQVDAIVPMPMHPRRWFVHGENHAQRLANAVGKAWNIPVLGNVVKRQHHTAKLAAGADKKTRQRLMKRAFASHAQSPKRVCIVDDVITTGASCEALTHCLIKAGAEEVFVVALARTM